MTLTINKEIYGSLLAESQPKVITTEADNEKALQLIEKLMVKGDARSIEENQLLDLLVTLVEKFEGEHYQLDASAPQDMLLHLMEARDLKQTDLVGLLGSKGVVSEVCNGKRAISKAQAKKLGAFFHVSPALFI